MDKKKGYLNLTEEEEKIYIPNRKLQLTLREENKRLRKAIEEKNKLIDKFKKYDEERKVYYNRFEQNYALMEERFKELAEAINSCEEIDDGTKEFYKEVVMRLYKGKVNSDNEKSILQQAIPKLVQMQDNYNSLEFCIMGVGNVQKRSELLNELRKILERHNNTLNWIGNKINDLK